MEEKLLNYLSVNSDSEYQVEHENEKDKFYKELEETIFDYISNNIKLTTNKIKMVENLENLYIEDGRFYDKENCQQIASISPENVADKLYHIIDKELDQNIILKQFANILNSVFEDIKFLSMVTALVSLYEKKKENFAEQEKYEAILNHYKNLPEIIKFLDEKNHVQIQDVKKNVSISKEEFDQTINSAENLFNIRKLGQNMSISLAPKGRKIQKYIRHKQEKIYSAEDMEKFIYINSHHIMKSFCTPLSEISDGVFVIPLSPQRKRKLLFEYRYIRKEIEPKTEVIDAGCVFKLWPDEKLPIIDLNDIKEDRRDEATKQSGRIYSRSFTGYTKIGR